MNIKENIIATIGINVKMQREFTRQRQNEDNLLTEISKITSVYFAEVAAGALDSKKHLYSYEAYLELLSRLKELLLAGMPEEIALDAVQTCETPETILKMWRAIQ